MSAKPPAAPAGTSSGAKATRGSISGGLQAAPTGNASGQPSAQPSRPISADRKPPAAVPASAPPTPPLPPTSETLARLRDNCMRYVFDERLIVVQRPFVRLVVYAKYGPAVEAEGGRFRLRGGRKGELLRPHEEALLLDDEEMALLADVYASAIPLAATMRPAKSIAPATIPDAALGEMNSRKDPAFLQLLDLTEAELSAVLDEVQLPRTVAAPPKTAPAVAAFSADVAAPAAGSGAAARGLLPPLSRAVSGAAASPLPESVVANAISNALLRERQRRINVLKGSVPSVMALRRDPDVTKKAATRFYNRTFPKAYEVRSWSDPKDVLRALHRSAYAIAEQGSQNDPSLNLNVRCLRPPFVLRPGDVAEGWDGYCAVRRSHSGKATTLRR